MKDTLKLFAAAAAEMVRTRKASVMINAAGVGVIMMGVTAVLRNPNYVSVGLYGAAGSAIARAVMDTGVIYKRMKNERKLSSFNHG